MATKKLINFSTILKRSRCLNATVFNESTKVDSQKRFENLRNMMRNKNSRDAGLQQLLRSYIESMCNVDNATNYYYQVLELIESFNNSDPIVSDRILSEFTSRILPYVANPSYVVEATERYKLKENQIDSIIESASIMNTADRILKNHDNISKRFNIERECNRFKNTGLKYFVDSCADMIDTYNVKSYQKMNLTLEEVSFLLEKNGLKYNKQDLVKYVVEYYLVQNPYISNNELNNFRKALTESYLLEEKDLEKVSFLLNNSDKKDNIDSAVQSYLLSGNKDAGTLADMINSILSSTSKEDIITNIDKIVYLLWDFAKNKTFEVDDGIYDCMQIIATHIANSTKIYSGITDKDYSKEDIENIINTLMDISNEIEISGNTNPAYSGPAVSFIKSGIKPCISELRFVADILYSKSNLDAIRIVNTNDNNPISLNEFKIFKFHNLVNAAFNLDKFLKVKEKKLYNNGKNKINKFISKTKNILFGESGKFDSNIYSYIGEDHKADICIRQYNYDDSELNEITEFLESICSEYNDMLSSQSLDSIRSYYIINPGVAEINIKEASSIKLTESELKLVRENLDSSIDLYLETFIETSMEYKNYDGFVGSPIEEQILNFSNYNNFTMDHFEAALEALSFLDIDTNIIKVFGEKFSDYQFNKAISEGAINEAYEDLAKQESNVSTLVENWEKHDNVPANIQLEAYGYLLDIIEEASGNNDTIEDRLKAKGYMRDDDEEKEEKEEDSNENEEEEDDLDEEDQKALNNKSTTNTSSSTKTTSSTSTTNNTSNNKKEKSVININSIKLALMGLKTKFKDMNTKQKEISRNLDNSVRAVVKGIKDAMVSDRREAIIKGSIIPSFSRCIKNGIILVGLGVATQGIVVPIIVAIGGLAVSKVLTDRERLLLLDEIETELEVVEKELAIAESNNQIKKYRALLQYKKDLQRQYQRIRYNIRVGKDLLPTSSAGMPTKNN